MEDPRNYKLIDGEYVRKSDEELTEDKLQGATAEYAISDESEIAFDRARPDKINRRSFTNRKHWLSYIAQRSERGKALDAYNEALATKAIKTNATGVSLHPTKGYRRMSPKRLSAIMKTPGTAIFWSKFAKEVTGIAEQERQAEEILRKFNEAQADNNDRIADHLRRAA